MKNSILLILCGVLIFCSCKKNSSSGAVPNADQTKYYVASVRGYSPGALEIDSFTYSSGDLLTKYVQYSFDSTGGSPVADSLIFVFSYSGSSSVPSSYTFSQPAAGILGELHNLSYDGQNRVTKDLCPSRPDYYANFSYPQASLAAAVQFDATGVDYQKDTLYVSNGNMSSEVVYTSNQAGTADSLNGTVKFGYASNGNPLYHSAISGTIGHLLFIFSIDGFSNFVDFNSKNLINSVTFILPGYPPQGVQYSIGKDSKGRVSIVNYKGYPNAYRNVYTYY